MCPSFLWFQGRWHTCIPSVFHLAHGCPLLGHLLPVSFCLIPVQLLYPSSHRTHPTIVPVQPSYPSKHLSCPTIVPIQPLYPSNHRTGPTIVLVQFLYPSNHYAHLTNVPVQPCCPYSSTSRKGTWEGRNIGIESNLIPGSSQAPCKAGRIVTVGYASISAMIEMGIVYELVLPDRRKQYTILIP